ncbi:MAG: glycosyltransferase [Rickettsia endosymbiont of Argas persicus]
MFIAILIYLPVLFHIANNISYCVQNILKSVLFLKAIKACKLAEIEEDKSELGELPIYTILVPLYKELSKLRSIIKNISLINYPKYKLDVKIIIEEDDYLMIKEVALYNLPAYFHIVLVPKSFPRTKPKALNYALEYSRGEYIVVYDAKINLRRINYLRL